MTTKEMVRCKHCAYLVEDEQGNWICSDAEQDIHAIADDECSMEMEW